MPFQKLDGNNTSNVPEAALEQFKEYTEQVKKIFDISVGAFREESEHIPTSAIIISLDKNQVQDVIQKIYGGSARDLYKYGFPHSSGIPLSEVKDEDKKVFAKAVKNELGFPITPSVVYVRIADDKTLGGTRFRYGGWNLISGKVTRGEMNGPIEVFGDTAKHFKNVCESGQNEKYLHFVIGESGKVFSLQERRLPNCLSREISPINNYVALYEL